MLSNFSRDAYQVFIVGNDFFKHFDGMMFSFQVGCCKPEHRIYQLLLEKHELLAHECVFIDDSKENIDAAQQLGLKGIVYKEGDLDLALGQLGIDVG